MLPSSDLFTVDCFAFNLLRKQPQASITAKSQLSFRLIIWLCLLLLYKPVSLKQVRKAGAIALNFANGNNSLLDSLLGFVYCCVSIGEV